MPTNRLSRLQPQAAKPRTNLKYMVAMRSYVNVECLFTRERQVLLFQQ